MQTDPDSAVQQINGWGVCRLNLSPSPSITLTWRRDSAQMYLLELYFPRNNHEGITSTVT